MSVFENTTEKFQLVVSLSCGLVGKIDNKQCLLKAIFCDQLTGMEECFGVWYGIFYPMETLIEILDQLCWFGGHHGLIRGTVLGVLSFLYIARLITEADILPRKLSIFSLGFLAGDIVQNPIRSAVVIR